MVDDTYDFETHYVKKIIENYKQSGEIDISKNRFKTFDDLVNTLSRWNEKTEFKYAYEIDEIFISITDEHQFDDDEVDFEKNYQIVVYGKDFTDAMTEIENIRNQIDDDALTKLSPKNRPLFRTLYDIERQILSYGLYSNNNHSYYTFIKENYDKIISILKKAIKKLEEFISKHSTSSSELFKNLTKDIISERDKLFTYINMIIQIKHLDLSTINKRGEQ